MILYWRSVWSNDPVNCQFIVNKYLYPSFGGFDIRWFDATWHIKQQPIGVMQLEHSNAQCEKPLKNGTYNFPALQGIIQGLPYQFSG